MITGNDFIWLHLPKTGGTSTARLFRELKFPCINIDPDDVDAKHESIQTRFKSINVLSSKKSIITTRRLARWLLSDWHHKTKKMGLEIPFEPVRSGLFYSLRLGGTWVAADYWIHYFNATSCTHTVRLEHLEEDSNRYVLPLLPKGTIPLRFPNQNTNQYSRKIEDFFGKRDLNRIYENNPAWTAWEEKIYGNLTKINPINRLKHKANRLFTSN
ncbi:hypothetical protein [Synechococcus sp. NOUM97013]|uniref:hypothetical protein n=1 Tax=Synechococcus sp. NOUM97013 TaxID=1442555 RepID=UPI0016450FF1|nr:hypothetical protein [Synechococcus sp. NOUM97013]